MLRQNIAAIGCLGLLLAGCVGTRGEPAPIELAGSDDAAAALELRARLHAAGVPVEPATSPNSLFVYRRGMATLLSPVLQTEGLDRIIVSRSYAPAAGAGVAELDALARTLNERLNVASFKVADGALLLETNLTFIDRVTEAELMALFDWLDQIELAIRRVDADSRVLLLSTS